MVQHFVPATPRNVAKKWQRHITEKQKDSEQFALSPYAVRCRRQDLNLHSHYRNQALNLARLPIPPLRLVASYYVGSAIRNQVGEFHDFVRPMVTVTGKFGHGSSIGDSEYRHVPGAALGTSIW